MPTAHSPSLVPLRRAIALQEKIQALEADFKAIFMGPSTSTPAAEAPKTRAKKSEPKPVVN